MQKNEFLNYKKTFSVILCFTYVLQFPFFLAANFFLQQNTNNEWAFLVGFWSINILLIFIIDFFHFGMQKNFLSFCSTIIYLITSCCYFLALYHQIYLISILAIIFTTITAFVMRLLWMRGFNLRYLEITTDSKEESVIRISIYILPTILLSVVCSHIANVIPDSYFSIFIRLVYFAVAFCIIATNYLLWYINMFPAAPRKPLFLEVLWLAVCYLIFIVGIECFRESICGFIVPTLGITPILIRHKNTQ